jgi:hypothetical protein
MKALCVIPTYGHFDYALLATKSFLATVPDSRVALIDDGSPDWSDIDWSKWPLEQMFRHHFRRNERNLTRSWNYGLSLARTHGAEYAVAGNSDLIFPSGWFEPIAEVLSSGRLDLVGPATNAPGPRRNQSVTRYLEAEEFVLSDEQRVIDKIAKRLRGRQKGVVVDSPVNGFCMVARTKTWWLGKHSDSCVFHPQHKMTRNEDELIGRWKRRGLKCGIVPASYVFHFRGVSRDLKMNTQGALRMHGQKPARAKP